MWIELRGVRGLQRSRCELPAKPAVAPESPDSPSPALESFGGAERTPPLALWSEQPLSPDLTPPSGSHRPASLTPLGSPLELLGPGPAPSFLGQKEHLFNEIPGWGLCLLKCHKSWLRGLKLWNSQTARERDEVSDLWLKYMLFLFQNSLRLLRWGARWRHSTGDLVLHTSEWERVSLCLWDGSSLWEWKRTSAVVMVTRWWSPPSRWPDPASSVGTHQLSSCSLNAGVWGGQWHGTDKPTFHSLASMPQMFSLIQQKRETEGKQKPAEAGALLISKTWCVCVASAGGQVRGALSHEVTCYPSGANLCEVRSVLRQETLPDAQMCHARCYGSFLLVVDRFPSAPGMLRAFLNVGGNSWTCARL